VYKIQAVTIYAQLFFASMCLRHLRAGMLEEIKNINAGRTGDIQGLQTAVELLINVVEELSAEKDSLKKEVQRLRDENSRLKGGNARPVIKGNKKISGDISSHGREKGKAGKKHPGDNNAEPAKPQSAIETDEDIKIEIAAADLPADAVFKGYTPYIRQDLVIKRYNKRFLLATYYSASEGRSIRAALPPGETEGHYGCGIRSLINILHHYGNVTHSSLEGLMKGFGIKISAGSICNLLKGELEWAVAEQSSILQAGLRHTAPGQMDSTGNRQRGVNKVTHIITSPLFSVFYTLPTKSRMDCLRALQGNPAGGVQLAWHEGMETVFRAAGVSMQDCSQVLAALKSHGAFHLGIDEFAALLASQAPGVFAKQRIVGIVTEAMAFYYYTQQTAFPRPQVLMSDDAPEYKKIAPFHALCWVHDARYYNKLAPQITISIERLEAFKAQYWEFYQTLLDYKTLLPAAQNAQKTSISQAFDRLFGQTTRYGALDLCIQRTRENKSQLLQVLDFPSLPLHNNAAELAARRVVRKRDISLHTWTDWGTQLRDAFLSIIETAGKLGVSAYQYINDRITAQRIMPSLAQLISP